MDCVDLRNATSTTAFARQATARKRHFPKLGCGVRGVGGFGAVREAGKSPEEVGTQESGRTSKWQPPGITPGAAIENEL